MSDADQYSRHVERDPPSKQQDQRGDIAGREDLRLQMPFAAFMPRWPASHDQVADKKLV
jgi:hypothetical protein